jgi:hypothetical protein
LKIYYPCQKSPPTAEWLTNIIARNFNTDPRYNQMTVRQYPWSETHTTDQYLKLLKTQSSYRSLVEE